MPKQNISASVDEDVHEFVSQDHINTSGLVNQLIREYMGGGSMNDFVYEFRRQQLLEDADDLSERADQKRQRAEALAEKMSEAEAEQREAEYDDAIEGASNVPADPENSYVRDHAEQFDMTPEEFAREISETHDKEYDPFNNTDDDLRSL